jgi:hypothetical protein
MNKILNKNEQMDNTIEKKVTEFSYYSNILNKPFKTLDELKAAEKDFELKELEKEAALIAKKNECNIVNTAIDVYEDGKAKCNEAIAKAYAEYKEKVSVAEKELSILEKDASDKLNKWLKEHPNQGFHYTYKSKDGKIAREYTYYNNRYSVFDSYDKFMRLLKDLWF